MNSTTLKSIAATTIFAALAIPIRAQESKEIQIHYSVTKLTTLDGTFGAAESVNNRGWVAGWDTLPGDGTEHALLWRAGEMTDLGTLGGANSAVGFPAKNDNGLLVGFAQTSSLDPLQEMFGSLVCSASGTPCQNANEILRAFLYQDGVLKPLPTLGGNNGEAIGINELRQVVGVAETSTADPTCIAPQVLDFKGAIWGPKAGEIQDLPPLPGDTISVAAAINNQGQAVGASGICGPLSPAIAVHPVLWQDGVPIDLRGFGGVMNNVGYMINRQGHIVGSSDLTGDTTTHAFFWKDGVMTDLGTLPGDFSSIAFSINDSDLVVGLSCDQSGNCRAFLWQNGVMKDLNTLIRPGSSLDLVAANDINDYGWIAGQAFDPTSGELLPFLAIRSESEADSGNATPVATAATTQAPKVTVPENIRRALLRRQGFGRLVAWPIAPQ